MTDKYKIPTSQKEIQEIITDKVFDSMKKRGLKVYAVIGWSELLGQPFILQNVPEWADFPRLCSLYPVAIQDTLNVKENGSIRPIYQVSNCRNAGHKWEAVE